MLFIEQLFGPNPTPALMQIFLVIFSVCCHEYAHARMALWQGDPTAAEEGHLTLNPLKQMGWMSLLMLAIIGFAWGMVPVNPARMKHRYSDALVAFAGPAMNLILFLLFGLGYSIAIWKFQSSPAITFMALGAVLNMVLFLFNLVPVPPLDGFTVCRFFFPRWFTFNSELSKGIMIFLIFVIFIFSPRLFSVGFGALYWYKWLFFKTIIALGLV